MRIMCERVGIYRRNNNSYNTTSTVPANNRVNHRGCCRYIEEEEEVVVNEAAAVEEILESVPVNDKDLPHQVLAWCDNALTDARSKRKSDSNRDHGRFPTVVAVTDVQ